MKDMLNIVDPDIIINTAAFTNVDQCELEKEKANNINVYGVRNLLKFANKKTYFIQISTDYVFDWNKGDYKEDDPTYPETYYGKTKLAAENVLMEASSNNLVFRTTVIYGQYKRSRFTNWVLDNLKQNKTVSAFTDQFNTPTLVDDLAKSLLSIFEKNISGMFHATGKSCLNRYEFALVLASTFGLDKKLIKSVTSKEKKQDAPRPTSTCLDSRKLEKLIDFNFSDIQSGVSFIFNKSKLNSSS